MSGLPIISNLHSGIRNQFTPSIYGMYSAIINDINIVIYRPLLFSIFRRLEFSKEVQVFFCRYFSKIHSNK